MNLIKIREYLGVALALVAALALGFGVITYLRYTALEETNQRLIESNSILTSSNASLSRTLNEAIALRKKEQGLLQDLHSSLNGIARESVQVRSKLEEIQKNDSEFKELLSRDHPASLSRLLNERTDRSGSKD